MQLDGLRGVAALMVLLGHGFLVSPAFAAAALGQPFTGGWRHLLVDTPLHLFWDGKASVIVFFVLSGFVLSLPFAGGRPPAWDDYYPRRILRLYLPVWAAVGLAVALAEAVPRVVRPGQSWLLNGSAGQLGVGTILHNLLLVRTTSLDTPLWSLGWEVAFSLLLPLYVFGLRREKRRSLGLLALVSTCLLVWEGPLYAANAAPAGWKGALVYLPVFAFGVLLAAGRASALLRRCPPAGWAAVLVASLLLLGTNWSLPPNRCSGLMVVAGAVGVVAVAVFWQPFARGLSTRPVRALGRWSFSLYLTHEPILVSIALLFHTDNPLVVLAVTVPVAIGASAVFYRLVERRTHRLAKLAGGRFHRALRREPLADLTAAVQPGL